MKTILRNLFYTLKRFQSASVLNLMGLSAAFAAFVLLMMKVSYERDFDTCYPHTDRLVMLNLAQPQGENYVSTLPRGPIDYLIQQVPGINMAPSIPRPGRSRLLHRPQKSAILLRGTLGRVSRLRKNYRTEVRRRQ